MLKRRAELLIVVVPLFVSGSLSAQGSSAPSCPATPSPQMAPFDTARVSDLVGAYDVVMFDTTNMRGSTLRHSGKLALWMQDSVPRRRGSTARRTSQRQFLVGSYDAAAPDTGEVFRRMANRSVDAPGAFWSDGFIRLGEFGQKSGISLYVRHTDGNELRGMWTTSPGLGIVVDFTGEREPDESGFFCARRMR